MRSSKTPPPLSPLARSLASRPLHTPEQPTAQPAPGAEVEIDGKLKKRASAGPQSPLQASADKLKALQSPRKDALEQPPPSPTRPVDSFDPDPPAVFTPPQGPAASVKKHKRMTSRTVEQLRDESQGESGIKRQRAHSFQAMRSPLFRSPRVEGDDSRPMSRARESSGSSPDSKKVQSPPGIQFGGPLRPLQSLNEAVALSEPPPQKFEFDKHVVPATRKDPHPTSLVRLFPSADDDELQAVFQCDDQEFHSVSTSLIENPDPDTGELRAKGSVSFSNFYGESIWIMASNYRDPDLASFHTSKVIALQAAEAGFTRGPDFLVQRMIESEDGKKFFEEHPFSHLDRMDEAQFEAFTTQTVNGKSSQRILREKGLQAVSAQVLIYKDSDDYESEFGDSSGSEDETRWLYSVVFKTAPFVPPASEAAASGGAEGAAKDPTAAP